MSLLQSIFLGFVQGISEFLPISSTAHLTLAGKFMGLIDPQHPDYWTAYIAIIQLGTMAAVVIYFFKDLLAMLTSIIADLRKGITASGERWSSESKLAWKIIIGSIPVGIIGLSLKEFIEGKFTKELSTIAGSMIVLALLLLVAEAVGKRKKTLEQTTMLDSFLIGVAQCFALIPGASRSGTTITGALFLGINREAAARFSFLLSIPAVLGSGLLEMYHVRHHIAELGAANLVAAIIVAGIVGYASIAFLLKYLKTHTTFLFIWYRLILGSALWVLIIMGMN
ncbi:MAG TPA: undecaprenyl-diphosphatase UppP [Bacteroidota bacterium]|nr:undecaprenyl-diphosphatase UppP [Bacteroidota bacterium]